MGKLLYVVAWLALAVSFPAGAVNVVYPDAERAEDPHAFYMDRAGDLYPPATVPVNTKALLNGDPERPRVDLATADFAALKSLYRWERERNSPRWQALVTHTRVVPGNAFDQDWTSIQAALRREAIDRINAVAAKDVVLLVHGFNNTHKEARCWYEAVESDFRQRRDGVSFVRMYWDGLSYGKGPGIWGEAQYNGPDVGHQLRRILNQLREDLPLRVFTHSSGAFVMANALGDGTAAFDPDDLDEDFIAKARGAAGYEFPKLTDLRVAMLVPAATLTTFANFKQGERGAIPARLILGTSRKDSATSKFWARCKWAGATCMAIKPKQACAAVRDHLGIAPPRVAIVDFPRPSGLFRYHGHGVDSYMEDAQWTELTGSLFEEQPGTPAGTVQWCAA